MPLPSPMEIALEAVMKKMIVRDVRYVSYLHIDNIKLQNKSILTISNYKMNPIANHNETQTTFI